MPWIFCPVSVPVRLIVFLRLCYRRLCYRHHRLLCYRLLRRLRYPWSHMIPMNLTDGSMMTDLIDGLRTMALIAGLIPMDLTGDLRMTDQIAGLIPMD